MYGLGFPFIHLSVATGQVDRPLIGVGLSPRFPIQAMAAFPAFRKSLSGELLNWNMMFADGLLPTT